MSNGSYLKMFAMRNNAIKQIHNKIRKFCAIKLRYNLR
jgi:hypothetical protein